MAATLTVGKRTRLKFEIFKIEIGHLPGELEIILNALLMIEGCSIDGVAKGEKSCWEVSVSCPQEEEMRLHKVVKALQGEGALASPPRWAAA